MMVRQSINEFVRNYTQNFTNRSIIEVQNSCSDRTRIRHQSDLSHQIKMWMYYLKYLKKHMKTIRTKKIDHPIC